jgi:hypothetical protein
MEFQKDDRPMAAFYVEGKLFLKLLFNDDTYSVDGWIIWIWHS